MIREATSTTLEDTRTADEAAIREVIEAIAKAVRANDVEAYLAVCAPDVVTFDMLPPLKHEGHAAVRRTWAAALDSFRGPIDYEVAALDVAASGDTAFTRCLTRFGGTQKDGKRAVNWLRSTLGLRKQGGRWKVVHEHVSVPFEMSSGRALLGLEP